MNKTQLGLTIQQLRKTKELSGKDLARQAGITADYLSRIERGLSSISLDLLFKLSCGLQCEPMQLIEAAQNRLVPTFANHEYENDRLDRLDFHTKALLHHMIGDLSDEEPTLTSWRGTVFTGQKPAQVQLRITTGPTAWEDES